MAYSSITINFLTVPNDGAVLNIIEDKLALNLNEIFKDARYTNGNVKIPPFYEYDGANPERYLGYVSSNYKQAFDLDYNTTNLFTVLSSTGDINSGIGSVTITANYSDANFSFESLDINVDVNINNETFTPPAPGTIAFAPNTINFKHEQNTPFQKFGIAMSGDLWKVVGKPNFVLSSATAGVTLVTVTDGTGTYQTVAGSGEAVVSITPTNYYNGSGTFLPADLVGSFAVLKDNVAFGTIAFTMEVTRITDFLTNPYPTSAKAFTLDTKFFEFRSLHEIIETNIKRLAIIVLILFFIVFSY